MRAYIFGGAYIRDYSKINIEKNSFIICADSGLKHVQNLKLLPSCILGDFDSYYGDIPYTNVEVIKYPKEKDDTDLMIAVKYAIEKKYDDIVIYGALGQRLDHTFASVQTLNYIYEQGLTGVLVGDDDIVMIQKKGICKYSKKEDYYFSIFNMSEKSTKISINGFKYNVNKALISNFFPIGVSNEILNEEAEIEVISGELLIIYSKMN